MNQGGEKRPFIVNIHDRYMQREMDIETWAVSERKAVANRRTAAS